MSNKKFLIIRPKYGLCNQLLSISKGIIFGIISNRDVIYSNFQLDSNKYFKLIVINNFKLIFTNNILNYLI
jgi:hypothetical protein